MIQQILITGFVKGGIYAVLVAGLSLTFGVARILNLSYTGFYMLAAYIMLVMTKHLGVHPVPGALLAILATTVLGTIVYKLVLERVKTHEITVMIISLSISLLFYETILMLFGSDTFGVQPFKQGFVEFIGVRVPYQKVLTIIVSIAVILSLELLLTKTRLGTAIRAVANDTEIANVMGINVNGICMAVTAVSMALAGVAGVMVAPIVPLDPQMWISPLMVILAAIVLGGLGSVKGSILAAFILGYVETTVVFVIPLGSFLKEAVLLAAMAGMLLVRPEGLFGLVFEEERL